MTSDSARAAPAAAAVTMRDSVATQDSVVYVSAAQLHGAVASLARSNATTLSLSRMAGSWVIEGRRVASGVPELHRSWTDVVYVQAGHAMLQTSGALIGGREESAGELRGGSIRGGRQRPLGVGDVVVIPAGVPHQYVLSRGDSLVYVTVKVPARR